MSDNCGKCSGCGGPMIPLFVSLVCGRECDLQGTPLKLDQTEGDSEWAGRLMTVDSGAIMHCMDCSCAGGICEGTAYRVNNYTGHVMFQRNSLSAWVKVAQVDADNIDSWLPKTFPKHKWRNIGS